jgi:hypothetical protein
MSTEIFANLNRESKYFDSQKSDQPFPVSLVPDRDGYHWKGGIGGQYRTVDLTFYTKDDDSFVEFNSFNLGNYGQVQHLEVTKNAITNCIREKHSSYWLLIIEHAKELLDSASLKFSEALLKEEEEERLEDEE